MLRLRKFACGRKLSSAWLLLLIALAGMMLPGRGWRVEGSRTVMSVPFWFTDWEKSPFRSSFVGTVYVANALVVVGQYSCDQKKKSFSRDLLKRVPGMMTGPPTL